MANGKKKTGEIAADIPFVPDPVPPAALDGISGVAAEPGVGGPYEVPAGCRGCVAYTHFDSPGAENNLVTILLDKAGVEKLPMQSLVRIKSQGDAQHQARDYLGVIVAGPFAEPDGLRADAALVVSTTVAGHGTIFTPRYHARAEVQILGEEVAAAQTVPARYRPRPASPVFPLTDAETEAVYQAGGPARLGTVIGHPTIDVGLDPKKKSLLPRHTGVLGTTGGGKSTTIARLVQQLTANGVSVVLFDVEGEYTEIDQPTADPTMLRALTACGQKPTGAADVRVHHLVGRDTSRSGTLPKLASPFRLDFADLSPFAVMEILELSDPQQERFLKAYDTLRLLMRELDIFPKRDNHDEIRRSMELDEIETGVPRMTLMMLIDVANRFHDYAAMPAPSSRSSGKGEDRSPASAPPAAFPIQSAELKGHDNELWSYVLRAQAPRDVRSWRGLLGKLWRIVRLRVFDNPKANAIHTADLLKPGRCSVIDLSDTDSPAVNNLVIATLLRQIQEQQEQNFHAEKAGRPPTPTVVIVEEAHEFLSAQRIKQMPVLFQQVARIAKRGRKRWLGLCFVTQLPSHLPDEILGLMNNFIIHKISDSNVIDRLRKSIAGLDKAQWGMVPALAPGQAVVSLTSMTRPLLTAIDPAPCRLRLVD